MKIFKAAAAAVLALALLIQMPARAYAQTQNADTKDYISEVKIATGSDAEKALEGYTILSDENGKAVDLNKDAGIREEPEFRLHHRLAHLCVLRDAVSFPGLQQEDEPVTISPETVFSGFITRLGFGEKDRVPYNIFKEEDMTYTMKRSIAAVSGKGYNEYLPWEYVMERDDAAPIDVNYGAASCNGDYCEDVRIHMFAQRSNGRVKPAGQITGGFLESTYEIGDVYLRK